MQLYITHDTVNFPLRALFFFVTEHLKMLQRCTKYLWWDRTKFLFNQFVADDQWCSLWAFPHGRVQCLGTNLFCHMAYSFHIIYLWCISVLWYIRAARSSQMEWGGQCNCSRENEKPRLPLMNWSQSSPAGCIYPSSLGKILVPSTHHRAPRKTSCSPSLGLYQGSVQPGWEGTGGTRQLLHPGAVQLVLLWNHR